MPPTTTEYGFTLPVGYVDDEGAHHCDGAMRLATARDEIEPLRDARVRDNGAYLSVLKLARVLTRVGDIQAVTPALVERLYAADFAHLQHLYAQINSASPAPAGEAVGQATVVPTPAPPVGSPPVGSPPVGSPPVGSPPVGSPPVALAPSASPPSASPPFASLPFASPPMSSPPMTSPPSAPSPSAPVPPPSARPAALAGVSDAAMRWMLESEPDTAAPTDRPERAEQALPIGLRQDRERAIVREALMRSPAPPRRGRVLEGPDAHLPPADPPVSSAGVPAQEPPGAPLMRLATRPPARDSAPLSSPTHPPEWAAAPGQAASEQDIEDIYEQMIARLRRELLVERERMGTSLGA